MIFSESAANLRTSEIRDLMSLAGRDDIISFAGGMPDNNLFPINDINDIYNNFTTKEKQIAMQYGPTPGLPSLIESLGQYLKKKGLPVESNKILITTGSLQAINIFSKIFIDPNSPILVENPCFIGAISAFKSYQANIKSIELTKDGINIENLENFLTSSDKKPRFFYFTPNFHNPAGVLYSIDTKKKLIQLFSGQGIPIIEDDVYSDLFFYDEDASHLTPLKSINPQDIDVCYTGSFSKILGPGLRLGWMLVSPTIYEKCELVKQSFDACSPSFTQLIADKFLRTGKVYAYTKAVKEEYKERCLLMSKLLNEQLPDSIHFHTPRGGFYFWLSLPESINATDILKKAIKKGALFVSGKTFDPDGKKDNHIRLSFCNTSKEQIMKGIPKIIESIKELV